MCRTHIELSDAQISAVQRRADEYERKISSSSSSSSSISSPRGIQPQEEKFQQRTPVTKIKGADSNYSKSSSMSNLSPFGTLEDVHDFEEEENDAENPTDGSLALSESNDASMTEMSFASL